MSHDRSSGDPLVQPQLNRDYEDEQPLLVPGRGAHMQVRVNVLQNIRETQFSRIAVGISVLFNLPQIIAIAVVLAQHYDPVACDKPLSIWALVHGVRLSLYLLFNMLLLSPRLDPTNPTFIKTRETLDFMGVIWFIVGNWWILNTSTCHANAPAVYQLCMILLIILYIVIFLPCILLVLMIPIVCFCLPCLLRLVSIVNHQGAEESAIRELPETAFHRGMFSEDNSECAICLSTYEENEPIRQLACHPRHHYHKACIDNWLRMNDSCPTCRAPITRATHANTHDDHGHHQQQHHISEIV